MFANAANGVNTESGGRCNDMTADKTAAAEEGTSDVTADQVRKRIQPWRQVRRGLKLRLRLRPRLRLTPRRRLAPLPCHTWRVIRVGSLLHSGLLL